MTLNTRQRSVTRRSVLAAVGTGAITSTVPVSVVGDENNDGRVDTFPDDCDEYFEDEEGDEDEPGPDDFVPTDGTQIGNHLSPDGIDAVLFDLRTTEFVTVAARFESTGNMRFRDDDNQISVTAATGEPAAEHERIDRWSRRSESDGYEFEPGDYELRFYAETDFPCFHVLTRDNHAGSWTMAIERGAADPPSIQDSAPIENA